MRGCCKGMRGEIVGRLPSPVQVAELGSGSGKKTRWILEALSERQRTYYYPIEISPSALAACEKELGQIDLVSIVGYEQPYLEGLRTVAEGAPTSDHLLVLFLGSTIGNFDRDAAEDFLREVRADPASRATRCCWARTWRKASRLQLLAYDDPAGVTAAFNLNLLARINRELRGDFDLEQFPARSALERKRAPHRNAPALDLPAARRFRGRTCGSCWTKTKRSGRKARTNTAEKQPNHGRAHGIPVRRAVDR